MKTNSVSFRYLSSSPILQTSPSCNEKILQCKVFVFAKKPMPPIAYEIANLPRTKPLMRPDEMVRIFPMALINRCGVKVAVYQRKHRGIRELDIALEMVAHEKWHVAAAAYKKINLAPFWIEQVGLSYHGNVSIIVEDNPELPTKLKEIPILKP
ncbi:hypothetical protein GQ600_24417 [Phytophthora cactorum]|nr:hypothetical protein GQ600_24417 [Phytophthora cactorum]